MEIPSPAPLRGGGRCDTIPLFFWASPPPAVGRGRQAGLNLPAQPEILPGKLEKDGPIGYQHQGKEEGHGAVHRRGEDELGQEHPAHQGEQGEHPPPNHPADHPRLGGGEMSLAGLRK